jgi:hypothetical protein
VARITFTPGDGKSVAYVFSTGPQSELNIIDEVFAVVATPVFKKFLGIAKWRYTDCWCHGIGIPVRDQQHSTDGFWTIDVEISRCRIWGAKSEAWVLGPCKYLRLEVKPQEQLSHAYCDKNPVKANDVVIFKGPVYTDHDDAFLECHPREIGHASRSQL